MYQTYETTIFEHNVEVNECELTELMEKIVITKNDPEYPETDSIQNVLVHTRKMDNLELIIKTVATQNDEIMDYSLVANVFENNGLSMSSRSMSQDELKRFKTTWRKPWRPNFSDDELYNYAVLDTEMQPQRDSLYSISNKMETNFNHSNKWNARNIDQMKSKKKSQYIVD